MLAEHAVVKILDSPVNSYKSKIEQINGDQQTPHPGPIQSVIIPGNEQVKTLAKEVQDAGIDVRAILSPTVPKGTERLRISLHTFNTEQQLQELMGVISSALKNEEVNRNLVNAT